MLPSKFQVLAVPFRRSEEKIEFQDGGLGSYLGFLIRTILTIFYLQVTLMLPSKFQVYLPLMQKKKQKTDFQDGGHLGFLIRTILAVFNL